MKEIERKAQWCPHRRTAIGYDPPGPPSSASVAAANAQTIGSTTVPVQQEIGTCIGSGCSQWRWDSLVGLVTVRPDNNTNLAIIRLRDGSLGFREPLERPPDVDPAFIWRDDIARWTKMVAPGPGERHGHCGLAGDATHD